MAKAEVTTNISASPELVFSYIIEPAKYLQWQSHLLSFEPDGEMRVGMRVTSEGRFLGRRIQIVSEVTQLDPPKVSAFKTLESPLPMVGTSTVEPTGDGCRYTQTLEVGGDISGFFGKLAEPVLVRMYRKQMQANHEILRGLAEAEAATGPS